MTPRQSNPDTRRARLIRAHAMLWGVIRELPNHPWQCKRELYMVERALYDVLVNVSYQASGELPAVPRKS